MDILTKALDLMERAELDADGDLDYLEDDEDKFKTGKRFQNENAYNQHLPYDVTEESQRHLMRIKASLAKCIQLDQETVYEWFIDLERYIHLYGLAFSKEDHIYFVRLQYELIISKNSMDLYYIAYVARCFSKLMHKRFLISSDELQFDWRQLYEAYERLLFSETESLGLRFVPETLELNLSQAIVLARPHFSLNATQEMLDEWRPMLCPFSASIQRAITYFNLFLPTTLPPEHHDKGFKLWFDEVLQLWLSGKVNVATYESKLTLLLSRLASDCLGFIDWEPYMPRIFNHIKSSLNLSRAMGRNHPRRNDSIDIGPYVQWMVYMISENTSCLDHIAKLFKAIESFYHPSNTDRRWHSKLQQFLYKLPAYYVKRIYRERFKKNIWSKRLPESYRLTDASTSRFVDALLPVVLTSMFNQAGISSAALALRDLAILRPEKVIPPLLERVYGSYETLTEPHRLLASINCMASVVPAMVRPCKYFNEGPSHVVPLLLNSLPGIDSNDMRKCITVFRFIATLAAHIRMKDYSYLVEEHPDLTEEQQQLCLSTSQFEDFVLQFLDKSFVLIENTASAHSFSNLDHEHQLKNGEEGIIEAAISSVTLSILAQASFEIQQSALDRLYSYVTRNIFDTKTRGKAIATLCLACARATPKETLAKFVPHFGRLIMALTENEEVFQDSILDDELLFSLLLMSEIVRCNSPHLLEHKDMITQVLHRALRLTSKEGYMLGCSILRHLLRALTNISCCDWKNIDLEDEENRLNEEKWPFDNWGHTINIKELKIKWQIPGPELRAFAQELLEIFLKSAITDLLAWSNKELHLTKDEIQRSLHIVLSSLVGAASVLPPLDCEPMNLCNLEVPFVPMCISYTGTDPMDFVDGTNIRTWVLESIKKVLAHINQTCEDDTKSLTTICEIYATAVSYFGYNKTELRLAAQRIKSMKNSSQNKLLGSRRHLRYLLVERVVQQHRAMLLNKGQPEFTRLHLDVFLNLFELAQSHYVEVRVLAQDSVYLMLNYFPFLETIFVPRLVKELKQPEIEHKKFKGLLYLVVGRRSFTSIAIDPNWWLLKQLWPALVESPHSEKPSIVKLLDRICNLVSKSFDTFELRYSFPSHIKEIAAKIWSSGSLDATIWQQPDEQFVGKVIKQVEQRNAQRLLDYEQLVLKLVELIENPHLHWHRRIVAYCLFTQLMRDDCPLPVQALNLCLTSLISERLSIRSKAVQLVSAQLKLHKRKHIKRKLTISQLVENESQNQDVVMDQLEAGAGKISLEDVPMADGGQLGAANNQQTSTTKPPDKVDNHNTTTVYSNKWLQYKLRTDDYTKEEWDKLIFVDKPHIGFYAWPKELEIYEPYEKQPKLNRSPEELNQHELVVFKKFNDPAFVEKLVEYFCFEDQKGGLDLHVFDTKRPILFKGLFRNYGPCMLEPFKKYVIEYSTSNCEHKQKFVIEFLAGLLRGSKHWSYDMLRELKEFVLSILDQMTVSQENYNDWTGLSVYIFRHRDIKRMEWLLNYFITKATSPRETLSPTISPFIQASRLTLAHYALIQCEWRAVDHIFPMVIENLKQQDHLLAYANIRLCLASIYSLVYMFDDPTTLTMIPDTLANGPKRLDFIEFLLPRLAMLEKGRQSNKTIGSDGLGGNSDQDNQEDADAGAKLQREFIRAAADPSLVTANLPMDTETNDEPDMVLIAETLMKFRQLEQNSGVSSTSTVATLAERLRNHQNDRQDYNKRKSQMTDDSMTSDAAKVTKKSSVGDIGATTSRATSFVDSLRESLSGINVQPSSLGDLSEESQERKDAVKLMKLTSCWIIYNVCRMKSPVSADYFKLLPIICEMGRESNDPELTADSLAAVAILGGSTLSSEAVVESLKCVRKIISDHSWHARVAAAAFIEMIIASNLFKLLSSEQWRSEIEDIVINHLICDERIEVRESSSLTLSGMIHCEFTRVTPDLLNEFKRRANETLIKRKQANGTTVIDPKCTIIRHSGILCLCACVDAHPYTVPDYLPGVLTFLSDHLTDPQPISTTIKKTMSNFKRTHHDNWQSDKKKFTEDQLCILANLLVGPNYYA
uniref:Proteasome activator complex subunit 4 n=2 Tax=Aceria tosichella TaxID=561515 RepID=A0A6G1SBV8_9ACAR